MLSAFVSCYSVQVNFKLIITCRPDMLTNTMFTGLILLSVTMTTNHTLSSSEQSDNTEDVPFENASDNEQGTPMETNQSDQIENTGDC